MGKLIDLTGEKFGRWEVLFRAENNKKQTMWQCKCECGTTRPVRGGDLTNGKSVSCGCYRVDYTIEKNTTHGLRGHRLYSIWAGMKTRCTNSEVDNYGRYGGRGIKINEDWFNDFKSFYDWSMDNGYEDNLTIDRINNDGDYEPSNCRWATMKEQAVNKSDNKTFTIDGKTKTLVELCEDYNIIYQTVQDRLLRGWNIEDALKLEIQSKYNGELFELDGELKLLPEWCDIYGIKYNTVRGRLNLGWSLNDSLKQELYSSNKNRENAIRVSMNGENKTLIQWCNELGLKYDTVWNRIKVLKWTPIDALTIPLNSKGGK